MIASCGQGHRWIQRGDSTGHCSKCHRTFGGVTGFDMHLGVMGDGPGGRRGPCKDPETMLDKHGRHVYTARARQAKNGEPYLEYQRAVYVGETATPAVNARRSG